MRFCLYSASSTPSYFVLKFSWMYLYRQSITYLTHPKEKKNTQFQKLKRLTDELGSGCVSKHVNPNPISVQVPDSDLNPSNLDVILSLVNLKLSKVQSVTWKPNYFEILGKIRGLVQFTEGIKSRI